MEELVSCKPEMHVFICTNNKQEKGLTGPSCGPHINREDYKAIKQWIVEQRLHQKIFVTRTHCQGFCNTQGAVISIYPQTKFFRGITSVQQIKDLIIQEYKNLEQKSI